ncbi:MAG: hypothetical protein JXR19_00135 [Bacteroidia bacterium]
MNNQQIIEWLNAGDISIQYQVHRDLLGVERKDLQYRIDKEGWGSQLLSCRNSNGHWGQRFYQPKWTSTHYTLLDLRNLNIPPQNEKVRETIKQVITTGKSDDGGIRLGPSTQVHGDLCVNGMFLNYASYFGSKEQDLSSVVDSILTEIMPDGGFNCRTTRSGATHSSLHTTLSVLEGLLEFLNAGYSYRSKEILNAKTSAEEFILKHQLFISDRTGEVINQEFLRLPYPARWKYNILRALDYFRNAEAKWDSRMGPAINVLLNKRKKNGTWNLQAKHPGQVHVEMEKAGKASRWNTLISLRVLKHFNIESSK